MASADRLGSALKLLWSSSSACLAALLLLLVPLLLLVLLLVLLPLLLLLLPFGKAAFEAASVAFAATAGAVAFAGSFNATLLATAGGGVGLLADVICANPRGLALSPSGAEELAIVVAVDGKGLVDGFVMLFWGRARPEA
jgi:hypothetical protein